MYFLLFIIVAIVVVAAAAEQPETIIVSMEIEIDDGGADDQTTTANNTPNNNDDCAAWAAAGECQANPDYMLRHCAAFCSNNDKAKKTKATAYVLEGEDAGVGAFRFAEDYGVFEDIDMVVNVAQQLEAKLLALAVTTTTSPHEDDDGGDQNNNDNDNNNNYYTPPRDITHCGKRPCSAGKLWKRAQELRKADMHDAAGADLIRALLKSGIETDFIERCNQSLQWALGSIRKQREREQREAIEEAKLEKRREEEKAAMEEAKERKKELEANFVKFGEQIRESLKTNAATGAASVGADGSVQIDDLTAEVKRTFVESGPQGGNCTETIQLIRKIPLGDKTIEVLLIEARCHEMMGNYKSALSAAGRLVQMAASHDPWIIDSPRMMAATLGANAAMQLGLSENAISFYQTVLKFDPEQERARKQYRGLKKVVKLMDKADQEIQKGYNKAAAGFVDDCLSAMRGLDVDSPLFRSKIQLKQCTILSAMGKHEEALSNCDAAVELRIGNDFVSTESQKEALLVRAEALLLDMDYDEAVSDLRAAFDLVPEDAEHLTEKRELQYKLQSAMREQALWNGGQKDNRFNEHTGYPDGRPPQRDHAKILELPIDLEQRGQDVKCAWLKKQFKALVKKYHPDKYKGNKKRAARKFGEVKTAKEIMTAAWDCK